MSEHLDLAIDPQAALERAYPRWHVWQADETADWWAAVRVNLTRLETAAGCESYRSAETAAELAQLLDDEDRKAGVQRVPVRLEAWGLTLAHVGAAIDQMGSCSNRASWRIAGFESSTGARCPVNVEDGAVMVAQTGEGWAYAVYPVMAHFYQRVRGQPWNVDYITAAHAERLLAEAREAAKTDRRAAPVGAPWHEDGIQFLTGIQPGVGGVLVRLRARTRDQVPPADLERLEREAADG